MGGGILRTMHPAYINNRRTAFFSLTIRVVFILSFFLLFPLNLPLPFTICISPAVSRGTSENFEKLSARGLGVAPFPFLVFFYGRPEKSVNILPCIHVANSLTLEELTVYPLKNACDISSERSSLTRYEVKEGRERRWKRGGSFSKLYVKPTYTAQRDDCFAKEIAFFRTHVGLPIDNTFSPERKKRERASE